MSQDIPVTKGKIFQDKIDQDLKKNSTLQIFQNMAKVQAGKMADVPSGWSPDDLSYCS